MIGSSGRSAGHHADPGEPDDGHSHDEHAPAEPMPQSEAMLAFSQYVTTGLLFISALLSWVVFSRIALGSGEAVHIIVAPWISVGALQVNWSLLVDPLTAVMLVVVTSVSSLVHLYSIGYMDDDPHRPRFFAYLSLFTFAMLMLVTADNLVQMFFGWEGVGLASYLLIGFWYYKKSASDAAMKAFIVNRVGGFRLRARHLPLLRAVPDRLVRRHLRRCGRAGRCQVQVHRHRGPRADDHLPAALHGRDG